MGGITTIALRKSTVKRLQKFKHYRRETYDEIMNKVMNVADVPWSDDEGELTEEAKMEIAEGVADARAGRVYTTKEMMKKLGIE